MLKKSIVLLLLGIFFFVMPSYAHVLKSEGSIGAVLHIDPADDPIAGLESTFVFDLKDTKGVFHVNNCDCTFTVSADQKILSQEKIVNQNDKNGDAIVTHFTFAQKGIYQVEISGNPSDEKAPFNPFHLRYDIRVDRVSQSSDTAVAATSNSKELPWTIITGIIIISVLILAYVIGRKKESK